MTTPGFFELYPDARPALSAGPYNATGKQALTAQTPHDGPQDITETSQFHLLVDAPRYKMPPEQILSTFPPAGSEGDWRERLPQIVLKRRTLPWERNPSINPVEPRETAPPWLALVVLADGEGKLTSDADVAECATAEPPLDAIADVPRGSYLSVAKDIVDKVFPCRDELNLLCHVRRVDLRDTELALGDDDGYLAVVIANRLPQPAPPATPGGPSLPLKYTAYLVNLEHQLHHLLPTEPAPLLFYDALSSKAFVDAKLLAPAPDATVDQVAMQLGAASAQLATEAGPEALAVAGKSLVPYGTAKGLEPAAASWATGPAKLGAAVANDLDAARGYKAGITKGIFDTLVPHFRFPVLVSWEFTCTATGGFERLMNELRVGMLGTAVDEDETGAPIGAPPPGLEVAATGHVALAHRTRRGEVATSWYRGPFSPQPTVRVAPVAGVLPLAHAGDQLRRLVPDGREDVSLAALFEIGRLLTMNKPTLVAALMEWRRSLFGAARARELARQLAAAITGDVGVKVAGGRDTLEDLVRASLVGAFVLMAPDALAPAAQQVTAARLPMELVDLDAKEVLTGLGMNPALVARLGKRFGVDGLAAVPLAVAPTPVEPAVSDKRAAARLRGALDRRVDDLVTSVTKTDGAHATGSPARRRTRDTLDRLIADSAKRARTARRED